MLGKGKTEHVDNTLPFLATIATKDTLQLTLHFILRYTFRNELAI